MFSRGSVAGGSGGRCFLAHKMREEQDILKKEEGGSPKENGGRRSNGIEADATSDRSEDGLPDVVDDHPGKSRSTFHSSHTSVILYAYRFIQIRYRGRRRTRSPSVSRSPRYRSRRYSPSHSPVCSRSPVDAPRSRALHRLKGLLLIVGACQYHSHHWTPSLLNERAETDQGHHQEVLVGGGAWCRTKMVHLILVKARLREAILEYLSDARSDSVEVQQKALYNLASMTKVSLQNRSLLAQTEGTIQILVDAISGPRGPASHHLLSSLAELVQFHGNCTLAVRSGAVPVLMSIIESPDGEDLAGSSLAILVLLARFEEGLNAIIERERIVSCMVEVLKRRCMMSKEGAAEILLRIFDESEGCVRDALRLPELSTVLADLSVRGSSKAREKAAQLMKKMTEASSDPGIDGNSMFLQWY
ncbi:hypothetical protein GH714_024007 [Hevea brasiliensis]|uniref:U-box domain-containing protein n=1 Tax=Hevea brasiliensis TaxID=3981 RepID=A0A6A6LR02_HEVBR|nr:hypothetical protein GH714_024007 [Hevea brasiliensis]